MILWMITPALALGGRVFYIRTPGIVLMDMQFDKYLRLLIVSGTANEIVYSVECPNIGMCRMQIPASYAGP